MQVDLSGQWTLRGGLVRPTQVEPTIRIPPPTNRTMQSGGRSVSGRSRAKGSSVYVFMESGKDLKVTQTTYGLFFSFDRAIVEEYAFGENRMVNIGPIAAQRVAGWDGPSFVIETMDEKGNVLKEVWTLEDDGTGQVLPARIVEFQHDKVGLHALEPQLVEPAGLVHGDARRAGDKAGGARRHVLPASGYRPDDGRD